MVWTILEKDILYNITRFFLIDVSGFREYYLDNKSISAGFAMGESHCCRQEHQFI